MNPWRDLAGRERTFTENYTSTYGHVWEATSRTLNTGGVLLDVVDLDGPAVNGMYYSGADDTHDKTGLVLHYTVGELHGDVTTLTQRNEVSVAFLIGRNGVIYRLWDEAYWSKHTAGMANATHQIDKKTIAVELTNMGPLNLLDGILRNTFYPDNDPPGDEYCTLAETGGYDDYTESALYRYYTSDGVDFENGDDQTYRGHRYFSSFTDAQYDAVKALIRYVSHAHGIPPVFLRVDEAPAPAAGSKKARLGRYEAFADDAAAAAYVGVSSHVNWRTDGKWDIGPTFDWKRVIYSFPLDLGEGFNVTAENVAAYYRHTEAESEGGTYPIGGNTIWHGGVHLRVDRGTEIRACAPGVVVAARLNPDKDAAWGAFGSTSFILVRHDGPNEEEPSGAVPAPDAPQVWYSLYMHLDAVALEGNDVKLAPLTWLSDGTGTAPDSDLVDALKSGEVHSPLRHVGGGAPLWWAGEIGEEDSRRGGIHWEVFSEANQRPAWPTAEDEDYDLTCDPEEIFSLIPQPGWGQNPWNLDADEIAAYYQSDKCVEMRTIATRFCTEWGLNLEATLDRLKHRFDVGPPEDYDPYLWWPKVEGATLPEDRLVWHYNPIAFLETVETADAVSSDTLPTAPNNGSQRGTLTGMVFDTNKTFLLPGALDLVRALKRHFDANPSEVLIVGHADRSGEGEYNRVLSQERAESMAAFLQDDADAWLAWFSEGSSKQWGTGEDQHMLSALSDAQGSFYTGEVSGVADSATHDATERFQAWANLERGASLVVDGISGPNTRKELVPAYMAVDETTLPAGTTIRTHGCGEYHPTVETADGVSEAQNRRVEVFFFAEGVDPLPQATCPGPDGCAEHGEWLLSVVDEIELDDPGTSPTAFTFTCEKIVSKDNLRRGTAAMAWCRVYAFQDQGGTLVRLEGNDPPPQTDEQGVCIGLDLTPGTTYHLYFAGKELSDAQLTDLLDNRRSAIVEVTVPDDLQVHLPQSFSWWIALLHHVEAAVSDPDDVLTGLRKLYYNDENWDYLINRGGEAELYARDGEGKITNNTEVELPIIFALGKTYKMVAPDQFYLDHEGARHMDDRHDFVILPHGGEIQISHTLTGMESYRFAPWGGPIGEYEFPYPHSATTWAGDLGQAVDDAVTQLTEETEEEGTDYDTLLDTDPYRVQEMWDTYRDQKASWVQMDGNVHGVVCGESIETTFTSLSEVLESFLCDPQRDSYAFARFVDLYTHQGLTADLVRIRGAATLPIRVEVEDFAETFDRWGERRDFDKTRAVDAELVSWSLQHLCDALNRLGG
jgi:N-acetylmuramoyl-L-alanine amidase